MTDTISAFFQSLLPDSRPRPAPTRLTTETRTVGSSAAQNTKDAKSTTAAAATATQIASRSESGPVSRDAAAAGNEDEIRKRREQFLNGLSSGKGKGKGSKKGTGAASSA
jgi:ribosomal protein L19E